MSLLYDQLSDEQRLVVNTLDKHILLNAPAGTGKTNVLACRAAAIIRSGNAAASQILCLTFTNRACKELQARIFKTAHEKGLDITVKTIHSFCYAIIKEEAKRNSDIANDFLIYDEEDCKNVIASICPPALNVYGQGRLQKLQNFIEAVKKYAVLSDCQQGDFAADCAAGAEALRSDGDKLRALCSYYGDTWDVELEQWLATNGAEFIRRYNDAMASCHAVDFADLIIRAYELLCRQDICRRWQNRFRYISIDEMQDTSEIEYKLLSLLFPGRIILLSGDYFQTIYSWRGSSPDMILRRFTAEYAPLHVTFTVNYRSTRTLLNASSACLANLFGPSVLTCYPVPVTAAAAETGGNIIAGETFSFMDEARWIFNQIEKLSPEERTKACIMTRTNRSNKMIWNGVRAHNEKLPPERRLPFTMIDQFQLFKRQECKDVAAFLRLLMNKHDSLSLKRILLRFASRISKRTIQTIESASYKKLGISLCDFADEKTQEYGDPFGLLLAALKEENVVVFDVESTGTNTTKDEIIQVAAIRLNENCEAIEQFTAYLRPSGSVGDSYYIHHISDEQLSREGKDPHQGLQELLSFMGNAVVVGHNVTFDLHILRSELRRLSLAGPNEIPYYDTLDIFRRFYPNLPKHTLSFLSSRFTPDTKSSHDAFDDILATAALLRYALKSHILPCTAQRQAAMAMYLSLFAPISRNISELTRQSYSRRPADLIADVMLSCGVKAYYENNRSDSGGDSHVDRIENIRKLYSLARESDDPAMDPRDALTEFLRLSALSNSELDSLLQKKPQIPIITVHQAKGLEFEYVFLSFLQEGTFPLSRALSSPKELAEEKRLFYVAMTRAKKRLFLSWHRREGNRTCQASQFIAAIPGEYVSQESGHS